MGDYIIEALIRLGAGSLFPRAGSLRFAGTAEAAVST